MTPDELIEKAMNVAGSIRMEKGASGTEYARALISAVVNVALEETARVAEAEKFGFENLTPYGEGRNQTCDLIAAAIRAMKKD